MGHLKELAKRLNMSGGGTLDLDMDVYSAFHDRLPTTMERFAPTIVLDDAILLWKAVAGSQRSALMVTVASGNVRAVASMAPVMGIAERSEACDAALCVTEAVVRWAIAWERASGVRETECE